MSSSPKSGGSKDQKHPDIYSSQEYRERFSQSKGKSSTYLSGSPNLKNPV